MSGGLAEVLAAHEIAYERRAWPSYECSCGGWDGAEGTGGGNDDTVDSDTAEAARAHVADAVQDWLAARLASDEMREAVARAIGGMDKPHWWARYEDLYRADATAALTAVAGALWEGAS